MATSVTITKTCWRALVGETCSATLHAVVNPSIVDPQVRPVGPQEGDCDSDQARAHRDIMTPFDPIRLPHAVITGDYLRRRAPTPGAASPHCMKAPFQTGRAA